MLYGPLFPAGRRNVNVNIEQHTDQRPVAGGIYHDKSGSSFVVLTIIGGKVLLEYASGTVSSVDVKSWKQLKPQIAIY